jgi:hypothetical protein
MADYDVGVQGLSSPPPSSVLTPYRPAVSVQNNGIHDALASGTLRIYAADRLIFTTELYSATIPAGETRDALGTDYWTPPAEGKYLVIADVTCPLDQVESNNHLSPTAIAVSGGPPPPPTTVAPHGSQHEDGGADEVNIDGLHGRLADAQPALAHKASHMVGGSDAISVEGLPGQLLEAQGIRDHAQTHEALGTDRLNVDGLHGQLYNVQKPDVHDNSAHDPNYTTVTQFNNHLTDETDVHDVATNLEQTTNKDQPFGYPGLNEDTLVPASLLGTNPALSGSFLRCDSSWSIVPFQQKAWLLDSLHVVDTTVKQLLDFNEVRPSDGHIYEFRITAQLVSTVLANSLSISILAGTSVVSLSPCIVAVCPIAGSALNRFACLNGAIQIVAGSFLPSAICIDNMNIIPDHIQMPALTGRAGGAVSVFFRAIAQLTVPGATTDLWITNVSCSRKDV